MNECAFTLASTGFESNCIISLIQHDAVKPPALSSHLSHNRLTLVLVTRCLVEHFKHAEAISSLNIA